MDETAAVGQTQGQVACFQRHTWSNGRGQLEYAYMPASFAVPAKGITEVDTTCPVCQKPLRVAVKSTGEASAKWWGLAALCVILLPAGVFFTFLASTDTGGDKFGNNVLWFIGVGGFISALCLLPWAIYRARHPEFDDHVVLLAGAGNVVGHIGEGQPVPMHEHRICK